MAFGWGEPLYWLMRQHDQEVHNYFISMAECTKCGAKPGEPCVTLVSMTPTRVPGKETATHQARANKALFALKAYRGACEVDPDIQTLERQIRDLSLQVARGRRLAALQAAVDHLRKQLKEMTEAGWDDAKAVRKLKRSLVQAQTALDKLNPPAPAKKA
jgi:hypothetical protein